MTDDDDYSALKRVLQLESGKTARYVHWPPPLQDVDPRRFNDAQDYVDASRPVTDGRLEIVRWADANGLKYDGDVFCCLDWLIRRAGVCRRCALPRVPTEAALHWRAMGAATTGQGRIRTVPAALTLDISLLPSALEYAAEQDDRVAVTEPHAWGPWRAVTLYRSDLLPDFQLPA